MSEFKKYRDQNVLDAARERIHYIFDEFDQVYLSVSGGKDSSVQMQLVRDVLEDRDRGETFDVLFVDLEAQYKATIEQMKTLIENSQHVLDTVYWVCLPLSLRNAVSQIQPKWTCWNADEREKWVREMPDNEYVLSEESHSFDFFEPEMEFEDFVDEFARWYADRHEGVVADAIAIRSNESINRFRTLTSDEKQRYGGKNWTTQVRINDEYLDAYNVYPIYDWTVEDVWGYVSKNDLPYNEVYEQLYKNGVPLTDQRICQPFGDDQRNGLDQFRRIEPETWEKLLNRVSGVNFGNIYARTSLLGNFSSEKPDHLSWEEYAVFLLESVGLYSPMLRDHYTDKITTFIEWYEDNEYPERTPPWTTEMGLEDFADAHPDTISKQKWPSWERIAWAIERNDFWMKRLGFSQTKGGREKLEQLEDEYGDSLLDADATDDKHLREWKEEHDATEDHADA
jgi:predicted phosphoadenosine phosphosulfate sulfurtransferase